MSKRPFMVRVRGILGSDELEARNSLLTAINKDLPANEHIKDDQVTVVPHWYDTEELEALVKFYSLPEKLSALKTGSERKQIGSLAFDAKFDGLTQLYPYPNAKDPVLDIVFVTGVGGHAYASWASKDEPWYMWPCDYLREKYPYIRALTFGYDLSLSSAGGANSDDYAKSFHAHLEKVRTNDPKRPLILVGHSYGGNVIKKCLLHDITAYGSDQELHQAILKATRAIIFFAVPHRGMDLEDMVECIPDQQGRAVVEEINQWQDTLERFMAIIHQRINIQVASFYEGKLTRRLKKQADGSLGRTGDLYQSTPKENCVLYLQNTREKMIAVFKDHSNIVKFESSYDIWEIKDFLARIISSIGPETNTPAEAHNNHTLNAPASVEKLPFENFREHDRQLSKVLPRRDKFIGREALIEKLDKAINPEHTAARPKKVIHILYGITGSGKTHLALEWVDRHRTANPSRRIYWMEGRSPEEFQVSMDDFFSIKDTDLNKDGQVDLNLRFRQSVDFMLASLNKTSNFEWIMVIDGVTGWQKSDNNNIANLYRSIQEILTNIDQGTIIITTYRMDLFKSGYDNTLVGPFQPMDSMLFLRKSISRPGYTPGDKELQELGEMYGYSPRYLKRACQLMHHSTHTVREYLEEHATIHAKQNLDAPVDPMRECFDELTARNETASKALILYSFLDHSDFNPIIFFGPEIRKGYFESTYPKWLREINEHVWQVIKEDLSNFLFLDIVGNRCSIPPAVHQFSREQAGQESSTYILLATSLVASLVLPSDNIDSFSRSKTLLPHAEQCYKHLQNTVFREEDVLQLANLFRQVGRYDDAIGLYGPVIASLKKLPSGDEDCDFRASIYNNMGLAYLNKRDYEKASYCFDMSQNWKWSMKRFSEMDIYNAVFNKALAKKALGKAEEAHELFCSAENILNNDSEGSICGPLEKAKLLNSLGEVSLIQGYFDQAREHFQRALRALREHLETDAHPEITLAWLNLVKVSIRQGALSTAIQDLRKIMDSISSSEQKADNLQKIEIYAEIANWYYEYGKRKNLLNAGSENAGSGKDALETAKRLWIKVKEFYAERFGSKSYLTLQVEVNLGVLQSVMGHTERAKAAIEDVMNRCRQIDLDSDWVLEARIHLALILADLEEYAEADKQLDFVFQKYHSPPPLLRHRLSYTRASFFKAMLLLVWENGDKDEGLQILRSLSTFQSEGLVEWQNSAAEELEKWTQGTTSRSCGTRFSMRFQKIPIP